MLKSNSQKTLAVTIALSLSALAFGCGAAQDPLSPVGSHTDPTSGPGVNSAGEYCEALYNTGYVPPGGTTSTATKRCFKYVPLYLAAQYGVPMLDRDSVAASPNSDMWIDVTPGDHLRLGDQWNPVSGGFCTTETGEFWIFDTYSTNCTKDLAGKLIAAVDDGADDTWADTIEQSEFLQNSHPISKSGRLHVGFTGIDPSKTRPWINYSAQAFQVYNCRDAANKKVACPTGI